MAPTAPSADRLSISKISTWKEYTEWARQVYRASASLDHLKHCDPLAPEQVTELPPEPVWNDAEPVGENFATLWAIFQYKHRAYTRTRDNDATLASAILASLDSSLASRVMSHDEAVPTSAHQLFSLVRDLTAPDHRTAKELAENNYDSLLATPVPSDPSAITQWFRRWSDIESQLCLICSDRVHSLPESFLSRTRAIDPVWYAL